MIVSASSRTSPLLPDLRILWEPTVFNPLLINGQTDRIHRPPGRSESILLAGRSQLAGEAFGQAKKMHGLG
ncbi:MAG: hypothetical protein K0S85_4712 [Pseudomonas orientalis]|nr:hypothetical protein [Pseudomonas orientalis]